MYVEDFRKLKVYDKAVELCLTTYCFIEESNMNPSEAQKMKKTATRIPVTIANAFAQTNMKIRFKQLNVAKDKILEMKQLGFQLNQDPVIENSKECNIENHVNELLKMLNAYFGWLSRQAK